MAASIDKIRHPDYMVELPYMLRAWDVYRGGRHAITPAVNRTMVGRWTSDLRPDAQGQGTTQADADSERQRQRRLIYERTAEQSYICSHVRESKNEYDDRVARAMHLPFFRSIVDIYVSAVLRTDPSSEGPTGDPWATYWADADMAGTQHAELMRIALTLALVQNKSFVVVDKPAITQPASSRAEQIERGERAYAYVLSAADLVDWALDSRGRFLWAKVREDAPDERDPDKEADGGCDQYRVWYPDRWELHRSGEEDAIVGAHSFGRVPIVPLFARRGHESRRTLASDGVLADIVDIDLAIYNHLSLFHEQLFTQVFSQLAVPMESGEVPDLELGVQRVLGFSAEGGGRPMYLSPDSAILTAQLASLKDHIAWGRQLASVSRGRAEYSKEERSAASLQEESSDKNNAITSLVGAVERCDREVHELIAIAEGQSSVPQRTYSRDVSLKALSSQIADATSLSALMPPPAAMAELLRPIFARALREHGAGEDAIKRADEAITAAIEAGEREPADVGEVEEGEDGGS